MHPTGRVLRHRSSLCSSFARCAAGLLCWLTLASSAYAQQDFAQEELSPEQMELLRQYASIPWEEGPTLGAIGDMAEIKIPAGYSFTGAKGTQDLLELYGNPRNPNMLAAIVPLAEDEDWTLVFQFDDIGYVDDSDRESLDAEDLISAFREGISAGNEARRAVGAEELQGMSWQEKPFYDPQTNNLTWALKLDFPTGSSINYDIRMLGRRGVMEATLVGDPASYGEAVPKVKALLANHTFTSGNKYAEWTQGDKLAGVGLAGLVGGGAAVAAAKTGLLAKLGILLAKGGKAIIVGFVVVIAAVGSFLKRIFGGQQATN